MMPQGGLYRSSSEYRNFGAFAALKADGSVVTWGDSTLGGNSSAVSGQLANGVQSIFSNPSAFAALKSDGSVVTWGNGSTGGNSGAVASQLSSGVQSIHSTGWAFAALKSNGSVVTWGEAESGGSSAVVPTWGGPGVSVAAQLTSGVQSVYSNEVAFAALKSDGSVVTWGKD
ncbi:MAG: hypothetical protein ACK5UQ_23525 [Planctomycetota bacterium]